MYKGPWKVPVASEKKKRNSKDPLAPKIPPSAFLSFSNSNRSKVKSENENSTYAEITGILATICGKKLALVKKGENTLMKN